MLVHCSCGALGCDVTYILEVVTGSEGAPEIEQVPYVGERDHDVPVPIHELLTDAINFEEIQAFSLTIFIERIAEPDHVSESLQTPNSVVNLHAIQ